ncbi:ADP-ribosyl-[dinitrogen reductase] hydrolase [Methylomagnum ishizawai]|uniref:ADP-ribosyl-[dinitrogen reductase] hydrolase n=1 Tax=Methylomagnum ishizawai TaxID=1760988 RepID=A0A1Y6D4E0_9GAMM|nr:ADP-ribosyl-[dinitrogen reductase] hydrolase [Methylomagnum ishizawai]SMF97527.1 ADP-ribosyl-[dinitrogen reductase] hydrolase [Methylomagnum ishizawai]
MNTSIRRERALGAYLGVAIGDALGATVEFMTPREISHRYGVHDKIVGGGWLKLKAGQITDDTEMSLALGRAIVESGGWDLHAVAESFTAWLKRRPPDVGNTCRRGIRRFMTDGSLEAPLNPGDGGNGACMRNVPVVLATLGEPATFTRCTVEQSHITHHHPLSDAATLATGQMAQSLILGGTLDDCRSIAADLIARHPEFRFDPYPGRASGYIVDTLQTVLYGLFSTENFADCLTWVVNRGDDADTTGAIAGMVAGAAYGAAAIPTRWLKALDPDIRRQIEWQADALLDLAERGDLLEPTHIGGGMGLLRRASAPLPSHP